MLYCVLSDFSSKLHPQSFTNLPYVDFTVEVGRNVLLMVVDSSTSEYNRNPWPGRL